jgi:hypothetical protein
VAQPQDLPQGLKSGQVLARFGVRTFILIAFAAFGSGGFGRSLAALLWMAIVFSAVVAVVKRERPFGTVLNHWDETVAYAAVFSLIRVVTDLSPI